MSETAVRVFPGERRASAGMKDPAGKDTLDHEGVVTSEDAWQALRDAVTESPDRKGADAE